MCYDIWNNITDTEEMEDWLGFDEENDEENDEDFDEDFENDLDE